MFGSDVLDVAIGIVLLFLFVSLICSALREALETALKSRASDLERGIREMLQDQDGTGLAKQLYDHPIVYALYSGSYDPEGLKSKSGSTGSAVMSIKGRANLPTYIPSEAFAAALIDMIRAASTAPDKPLSLESWQASAAKIGNPSFQRAVTAILAEAGDDAGRARRGIESWYNATMDRVSGWYKRRTQVILLGIGLITAVVFNVDALNVARHLVNDKSYRQAVIAMAPGLQQDAGAAGPAAGGPPAGQATTGQAATSPASTGLTAEQARQRIAVIRSELDGTGFLLGWPATQIGQCGPRVPCAWAVLQMVLGWVITALGVSLGAPFWFDLLNKFMVIRSTVKPAEKSGREGSKDGGA